VIVRKSAGEIEGMERAGQIVAATIALLGEHAQPGITTGELDRIAEDFIREQGGVPTSKGYRGFPAATCISPNAMVVHGIPGKHRVEEGDLISVDVGVTLDGLVADSAYTFGIGEIDPETQRLLEVGKEALAAGIDQARANNRVGDISHAWSSWSWKAPASRSSAPWSATGSAAPITRSPRSRTSASRDGARSFSPA